MKTLFTLSVLLLVFAVSARKSYIDYDLYNVAIRNEKDSQTVERLIIEGVADPFYHGENVIHLFMKKKDKSLLDGLKFSVHKTGAQIQEQIDLSTRKADVRHSVDWLHYNTLDEIYEFVNELAEANPTITNLTTMTTTFEGRPMLLLKIANVPDSPDRPIILLDAGIHAREWITPATMTYFLDALLKDPTLLDAATYYIVPVLNPDGYAYTWTGEDRLWRKTRSDNDLQCLGVDGNRNFDYLWGLVGSSDVSCSDTYMGPYPLSEAEFAALADFMNNHKDRIKAYLTLHSYGQKLLYPWGHTTDPAPNAAELDRVAGLAAAAIEAVYGTPYTYGSTATTLGYLNSGTSRDYALGAVGLNYTYTFELRDTGDFGFLLPEDQILDTATETYEGMKTIILEALSMA